MRQKNPPFKMTLAVVSLGLPTFLAAPPASSLSIHARWPLPFSDSVLGPFSLPHLPSFKHTYSQLPADISTQMPHKALQLSQSQMEATSCRHQCRAGNQLLCVWFSSRHRGLTKSLVPSSIGPAAFSPGPVTGASTTCPFTPSLLETRLQMSPPQEASPCPPGWNLPLCPPLLPGSTRVTHLWARAGLQTGRMLLISECSFFNFKGVSHI